MKLLPSTMVTVSFYATMFIVYTPFFGSAAPHGEIQVLTGKLANDQISHGKMHNAAELSVLKNKISAENLMHTRTPSFAESASSRQRSKY